MSPELRTQLESYRSLIDDDLRTFSGAWVGEWRESYGTTNGYTLQVFIGLLANGGKRLRGALAMKSYIEHGGTSQTVAIRLARIMELIQTYLLILDDIADNSDMRRGALSVHKQLEAWHKTNNFIGDAEHFGRSEAMNVALLGVHRAMCELMELDIPDVYKVFASRLLNEDISVTVAGQIEDIINEAAPTDVAEIIAINTLKWKTAYYTFVSPLQLGAACATGKPLDANLRLYALNAGIVFQITDDILSTFGASAVQGKEHNDDIKEGKATLMLLYAKRVGNQSQLDDLQRIIGNKNASEAECDEVRSIYRATDAVAYARGTAQQYQIKALTALAEYGPGSLHDFLKQLIEYTVGRER